VPAATSADEHFGPASRGTPEQRREGRQRAAVLATFLVQGLLFASWTAHIPEVKAHLGLSDAALGGILLLTPGGSVCAMLVTGRLLPVLGSRRMVQASLLGYCAAAPMVGLASSPALLAAALFAWGAFQGSLDVSMNTQAAAVQHVQGRHLMPTFHGTWSIGAFTGAGIGAAAVALHVGLTAQMLVLLLPLLVPITLLSPSMISDANPAAHTSTARRRRRFSRATMVLGAVVFAAMLCEGASADWSAVYLHGPAHVAPGVSGLGYAAFAVMMAVVRLCGTRLLARIPQERLLPLLAALATAAMAVALTTGTAVTALVGFAALGAGTSLVVPTLFSAAARLPGLGTGAGITAVSTFGWAGFVCGPPLIGGLAGLDGLRAALAVIPALTLVIALATTRVGVPSTSIAGAQT
jgi:fucose permease